MIMELRRRGQGRRESGAFLLSAADRERRCVDRVIYFDDLDPECLQGNIRLDGRAFSKLWDLCEAEDRVVVADVHTHPGHFVRQSSIDAANPMVARTGHVALIVPHLATRRVRPSDVGIHLYEGDAGWTSWTGGQAARRLFVRHLL